MTLEDNENRFAVLLSLSRAVFPHESESNISRVSSQIHYQAKDARTRAPFAVLITTSGNQLKMTRHLKTCVVVVFSVSLLAGPVSAQTLEEIEGHAKTVGDIYQTTQAEVQNSRGVFIRTAYKHGCLTSGLCNLWFRQVRIRRSQAHPFFGYIRIRGSDQLSHIRCSNDESDRSANVRLSTRRLSTATIVLYGLGSDGVSRDRFWSPTRCGTKCAWIVSMVERTATLELLGARDPTSRNGTSDST